MNKEQRPDPMKLPAITGTQAEPPQPATLDQFVSEIASGDLGGWEVEETTGYSPELAEAQASHARYERLKQIEYAFTYFWQAVDQHGFFNVAGQIAESTKSKDGDITTDHLIAWGLMTKHYQPIPEGEGPVTLATRQQMYRGWDRALADLKQWGLSFKARLDFDYTNRDELSDSEVALMLSSIKEIIMADAPRYHATPTANPAGNDLQVALYQLRRLKAAERLSKHVVKAAGWTLGEIAEALSMAASRSNQPEGVLRPTQAEMN